VLVEVTPGPFDDVVALEGAAVSVDVVEVSREAGTVEVAAPRTEGDTVPDELLPVAAEVSNVGAVDVELTKGGALSMYEPSDCTA
jgi:hypothetical protein